jgi:hypothetical protein
MDISPVVIVGNTVKQVDVVPVTPNAYASSDT